MAAGEILTNRFYSACSVASVPYFPSKSVQAEFTVIPHGQEPGNGWFHPPAGSYGNGKQQFVSLLQFLHRGIP